MPAPRTSSQPTLNESLEIQRRNIPAGLDYLPAVEPAPPTPIARAQNKIIEAQAGNVNFPLRASDDDLGAGTPKNARGGAGRVSTTEGGRQQGHRGDRNA